MCTDFPHPIRSRSYKEGPDHIVQNRPGSDLHGLVRFWPNASGPEASRKARIIGPGFWQNATGPLPVSPFLTRLRSSSDGPDLLCKTSPDPIWLWSWTYMYMYRSMVLADCVRFWPNRDPFRKQAGVQDSSGSLLDKASQPIWNGCQSDPVFLLHWGKTAKGWGGVGWGGVGAGRQTDKYLQRKGDRNRKK